MRTLLKTENPVENPFGKPVYNNVQNNKTLGQNPTATLALESTIMKLALQYCQCCRDEFGNANILLTSDSAPLDNLNTEYPLSCEDKNVS